MSCSFLKPRKPLYSNTSEDKDAQKVIKFGTIFYILLWGYNKVYIILHKINMDKNLQIDNIYHLIHEVSPRGVCNRHQRFNIMLIMLI